jgi:hypothetical protein
MARQTIKITCICGPSLMVSDNCRLSVVQAYCRVKQQLFTYRTHELPSTTKEQTTTYKQTYKEEVSFRRGTLTVTSLLPNTATTITTTTEAHHHFPTTNNNNKGQPGCDFLNWEKDARCPLGDQ